MGIAWGGCGEAGTRNAKGGRGLENEKNLCRPVKCPGTVNLMSRKATMVL